MEIHYSVKDSDNLLSYNQWSCGDYSKNLDGFTLNGANTTNNIVKLDNSNPTKGDYNILMNRIASAASYLFLKFAKSITEEDYGKTLTVTADIKNNLTGIAKIQIVADSTVVTEIPQNASNSFSVSKTIPENTESIECQITFAGAITGKLYIDNLRLTIQ